MFAPDRLLGLSAYVLRCVRLAHDLSLFVSLPAILAPRRLFFLFRRIWGSRQPALPPPPLLLLCSSRYFSPLSLLGGDDIYLLLVVVVSLFESYLYPLRSLLPPSFPQICFAFFFVFHPPIRNRFSAREIGEFVLFFLLPFTILYAHFPRFNSRAGSEDRFSIPFSLPLVEQLSEFVLLVPLRL